MVAQSDILQKLYRPGDLVKIDWGWQKRDNLSYGDEGEVTLVTKRLIEVKHSRLGYGFSVSLNQIVSGVRVTVIKRKEEQEMSEVDGQHGEEQSPPEERPRRRSRSMAWREILTRDMYLQLKALGRTDKSIRLEYGIQGDSTWQKWKRDQGLLPSSAVKDRPARPAAAGPEALTAGEAINIKCICGGDCRQGGMTLAEALTKVEFLREDIACVKSLLAREDGAPITQGIRGVLKQALSNWEAELAQLENARVQLPA